MYQLSHRDPLAKTIKSLISVDTDEKIQSMHGDCLQGYCCNRAAERRLDIQSVLKARGFGKTIDLSAAEKEHKHFEGTGVLVLDRINGVAYVALSERADKGIAEHWVEKLGYKVIIFTPQSYQGDCLLNFPSF